MPRPKVVHCKICGGHIDTVGPLSRRKKCATCSEQRVAETITQMYHGQGEWYEKWMAGQREAFAKRDTPPTGATPPEPDSPQRRDTNT